MVWKHYLVTIFGWSQELDMNRKSTWSFFYSLQRVSLPAPGKETLAVTSHPYCGLKHERCKFVCVKAEPAVPTSSRWHFRAAASQLSVSEQRRRGQDRHVYHLPVKSNPSCSQRRGLVKVTHWVGGSFKVAPCKYLRCVRESFLCVTNPILAMKQMEFFFFC